MKMNALESENRLIRFAASVINFSDHVKKTRAGIHLVGQIIRPGTSPALNYAEARSAESKPDPGIPSNPELELRIFRGDIFPNDIRGNVSDEFVCIRISQI